MSAALSCSCKTLFEALKKVLEIFIQYKQRIVTAILSLYGIEMVRDKFSLHNLIAWNINPLSAELTFEIFIHIIRRSTT